MMMMTMAVDVGGKKEAEEDLGFLLALFSCFSVSIESSGRTWREKKHIEGGGGGGEGGRGQTA